MKKVLSIILAIMMLFSTSTVAFAHHDTHSSHSSHHSATVSKPAKVTGLKASSIGKNSATIKWSKASGATRYYIFRYNSSTKKYTSVGNTSSTSYTIKNLKSGTSYKFMVQSCKVYNGKSYWGSYSSLLNVTTKKSSSSSSSSSSSAGYYVTSVNSNVYHRPTCASAKRIKSSNRRVHNCTSSQMKSKGYRPCKNCKP